MAFRRLLAVLILGVVLGSFAPSARLEAGERARDIGAVLDVMPGMDEQFETVDELIEDEEWDRLLQKLSQIVDEAGDSVWAPKDRRVYISIRDYVRRLIMSLPAAGLANYRARYDAEAAGLYERGRQARAIAYLDAVDRRFPASSYAAPALDAAASLLMDGGRYGAAAGRLERLVNRPAMAGATASEKQVKRMALAKLAFCRAKLGDMDGAASAIRRLKKAASPGELRLAGGELSPQAYIRRELERGPAPVAGIRAKDDWPSPGGHLDHRPPMLDIRSDLLQWWWKKIGDESKPKKTPNRHVTSAIQIRYYAGAYGPLQMEAAPIPVTDREGVVYVNTGKGVFAIDHITGRLRWVTRPGSAPAASGQPVNRYNYAGQALAALWHRWQGATTASHGEGKVFAVEMLGSGYPLCLALTAFDASSGERLWSFEQGPDGVGFEGQAYFPWAPKYVDGRVVGLACFRDQMHLCALDAATGEVAWKTFLAADPVPTYNYRRPMFLRRLGQPVVIADGVAYAATGMGAVAAVDVGSGELYWISKYKRTAIQVKSTGSKFRRQTQYSYEGGWKAGFPVVSGGKLYVAPWDAKELLVFDARSGELSRKVRRGEFTHFAGVHRGSLILSGEGDTAAVDPHTGHLRWLVPTGVKPSGVPILTESAVVVPGERKLAVVKLGESPVVRELQSAKRRPEFPSKLGLGNVVSCSGRLVTANPAYVSGFFSYEKTRAEVTRLVEEHPARAKPLLDRADVSSLGGDRELEDNHRDAARRRYQQALADLQAAERIIGRQASTDSSLVSRHRRMMFETRLKLSETDPSNAVTHIDAARPYIYNPVARARFHLARGAALATAKRYQDAVDEYIHVIGNLADTKLRRGESRVPVGVLAQDRIGRLVEKYGGRVYARVDRRLKPRFDRLVREKDPEELRELQVKHPHSSLADNCLLEMARIVSKREHGALRSQTLLRSLTLRYPESEVLGEAYGMLLR
ncbi:MAG: PQQ-binding-like beta-propeller repeat protein, partial [Planctomycetota bacterium]